MPKRVTKSKPAPTTATPGVSKPSRIPTWLIAVMLALVTLAIFWPATRHEFVHYDDDIFVTANVRIQKGLSWENVKWAFANPVNCIWHPLTTLSHMADCQFFQVKPWGHHLTSILLHGINTALVFLFLRCLTGAFWRSVLVAMLFGLHPSHVESVAWVAERKDVLSGCFGFLALIFYARYARERNHANSNPTQKTFASRNYWLTALFFLLGLMSKPMLVTWPFVMLLLDFWPLERFKRFSVWQLAKEKIPFFALSAAAAGMAFVVEKQAGALTAAEVLPLSARAGNAVISLCRYLGMQFWPVDLAVFYPHPGHWPMAKVLSAAGFITGVSVFLFAQRRRFPFLLIGWLWFCGTMVPVIGLVQVGEQALADRYTYLPTLGVFVCVVWGAYEFTRRWRHHLVTGAVAGSIVVLVCGALTRPQLTYWQDTGALFRRALAVTKNNHLAHFQVGTVLQADGHLDEAIDHFHKAIRLKPGYADAHNNLGIALGMKGQLDEAISELREATRLKPGFAYAHHNLGHALGKKGNIDEAISELQEALRLQPDYPEAHYHLGTAFLAKNDMDAAIHQFREALKLQPDNADVHNSLGATFFTKGDLDAAVVQFQETLRLNPNYNGASNNLALAREEKRAAAGSERGAQP